MTCGHHVQMSIGTCLAPCSRARYQLSCATSARAMGSSSPVPSPVTRDSVSLPPACSWPRAAWALSACQLHVPPCPTLRTSKVSFTLKISHFRDLISIFLLVFRGCCLKYLHAPFCSCFLPQRVFTGESQMRSGCSEHGQALLQCPGLAPGFGLFPLGYQLCPWSGVRQTGACVPCSPRAVAGHPSPSPGVLFPGAGAEAGQAEPARQAVLGTQSCLCSSTGRAGRAKPAPASHGFPCVPAAWKVGHRTPAQSTTLVFGLGNHQSLSCAGQAVVLGQEDLSHWRSPCEGQAVVLGQEDLCSWRSLLSLQALMERGMVFGAMGLLSSADLILCPRRMEACSDPGSHRLRR